MVPGCADRCSPRALLHDVATSRACLQAPKVLAAKAAAAMRIFPRPHTAGRLPSHRVACVQVLVKCMEGPFSQRMAYSVEASLLPAGYGTVLAQGLGKFLHLFVAPEVFVQTGTPVA